MTPSTLAPPLTVRLLGSFEVCLNGAPFPRLRSQKGEWLLALLVLRAGGRVERDWLAAALWPDSPEPRSRASLRRSLTDLRHALGTQAARLRSPTAHTLAFDLAGAVVDIVAFDAAIKRGDTASLEEAVTLYRGPLLQGCSEGWAFEERQAREQAYLEALERLAADALVRSDAAAAERWLRRAVTVDPLRESAQRALMQALAASGSYAAATQLYRDLRVLLHRELNATPDPETTALYETIRAAVRCRAEASVLPRYAPPGSPVGVRHHWPLQLTRFIGREQQIAELEQWLTEHRLVTLTGGGGCGKTRLALAVAEKRLDSFADGVWFVDLAPLADPELVPQTVATALGLQEWSGHPPEEAVQEHLKARQVLIVLDNCEHLIEACAQLVHALLQTCPSLRVLATSREALGISGERAYRVPPLSLPPADGTRPWGRGVETQSVFPDTRHPLGSEIPAPDPLMQYEAVRLFSDRAKAVQPSFRVTSDNSGVVAHICHRLEGIPFAIELAAARVKVLPVLQIAAGLDDIFRLLTGGSRTALPRQQTLRATMDWSYALLSEAERVLLRRLSVFAGGWDLASAEAVVSGETDGEASVDVEHSPLTGGDLLLTRGDTLDLLTQLVEKSLVVFEARGNGARYRLLELVRQYGLLQLRESGEEEAIRGRHRDHYLRLAEAAEPELHRADQVQWLDRLQEEHDNLRAALGWCLSEESGAEKELRLLGALGWFWVHRGHFSEGQQWMDGALARSSSAPAAVRAKALRAGWSLWPGHGAPAGVSAELSLALSLEAGDPTGAAHSLFQLAMRAIERDENDRAAELAAKSLAIVRETDGHWLMPFSFLALGLAARNQGEYERARTFFQEGLEYGRQIGDHWMTAMHLNNLGRVALVQRDLDEAKRLAREALMVCQEIKNRRGMIWCLAVLAEIASVRGQVGDVARLLGAVDALLDSIGLSRPSILPSIETDVDIAAARTELGEAAFTAAWAEGRAMKLADAIAYALADPAPDQGGCC